MLEVLKFIFHSFWTWSGTAAIVAIISNGLSHMFSIRIKKVVSDDLFDKEEDY